MKSGRIALLIIGVIAVLAGLGLAGGGAGVLWLDAQRDAAGFLTTPTYAVRSDGYAVTTRTVDLLAPNPSDWVPWSNAVETKITATNRTPDTSTFIGIASAPDVRAYLEDVSHDELTRSGIRTRAEYRSVPGQQRPSLPTDQTFWVAQRSGAGEQVLEWTAKPGSWVAVVMNADATPGVATMASGGIRTGDLWPIGVALAVIGLLIVGVGGAMVVGGAAGLAGQSGAAPSTPRPVTGTGQPSSQPRTSG